MRHFLEHATMQPGRRSFLLGTAGALAAGLTAPLGRPRISQANSDLPQAPQHLRAPLPPPKHIPGGIDLGSDFSPSFIHIFGAVARPGGDHPSLHGLRPARLERRAEHHHRLQGGYRAGVPRRHHHRE